MNTVDRIATIVNPLSTGVSLFKPDVLKAAPTADGWRLSNNARTNFALWNTLGVASWAIPLAIATTALVNMHAKRKVDKARDKSEDLLLAASRPALTPTKLGDNAEDKNADRLKSIETDNLRLSKSASLVMDPILTSLPVLAVPASYWLANKLATNIISNKIESQLADERKNLRRLQDDEDLKRLKLLGMIEDEDMTKEASGDGFGAYLRGKLDAIKDGFSGVSMSGLTKTVLWDAHVAPAIAAAALLAVGGGAYLSKRDKNTKKIQLLTKKLLGENRMYDPPALSLDLPGRISKDDRSNQMHMIEGLPSSDVVELRDKLENSQEKDALFS